MPPLTMRISPFRLEPGRRGLPGARDQHGRAAGPGRDRPPGARRGRRGGSGDDEHHHGHREPVGGWAGGTNAHYIGLSFESGTLNSGQFDDVGDLPQLLRNLGTGVMRFGGNSVDTSFTSITPSALAGLVRLAKATGWSALYSENLGHFTARTVTRDAHRVSAALGSYLAAFACGNEPDLFPNAGLRSSSYSESDYLDQTSSCLAAVRAGAPNSPIEGPDTSGIGWLPGYAATEPGKLRWLGQHYYPMGCGLGGKSPAAFASAMLSAAQTAKEAAFFSAAARAAAVAYAPLRISETNSACHGGAVGVSDAYASALWVVDYLLTGVEHGVTGFNFHGGLSAVCDGYTPLCQVGYNEYAAQPIYYGLLFTHLLGSGNLLPVTVRTSDPGDNLAAFALKPTVGGAANTGLRVIAENLTGATAHVTLRVRRATSAAVLYLTGPSPLATSGVRIQGAEVAADGSFTPGAPDTVSCSRAAAGSPSRRTRPHWSPSVYICKDQSHKFKFFPHNNRGVRAAETLPRHTEAMRIGGIRPSLVAAACTALAVGAAACAMGRPGGVRAGQRSPGRSGEEQRRLRQHGDRPRRGTGIGHTSNRSSACPSSRAS